MNVAREGKVNGDLFVSTGVMGSRGNSAFSVLDVFPQERDGVEYPTLVGCLRAPYVHVCPSPRVRDSDRPKRNHV